MTHSNLLAQIMSNILKIGDVKISKDNIGIDSKSVSMSIGTVDFVRYGQVVVGTIWYKSTPQINAYSEINLGTLPWSANSVISYIGTCYLDGGASSLMLEINATQNTVLKIRNNTGDSIASGRTLNGSIVYITDDNI